MFSRFLNFNVISSLTSCCSIKWLINLMPVLFPRKIWLQSLHFKWLFSISKWTEMQFHRSSSEEISAWSFNSIAQRYSQICRRSKCFLAIYMSSLSSKFLSQILHIAKLFTNVKYCHFHCSFSTFSQLASVDIRFLSQIVYH